MSKLFEIAGVSNPCDQCSLDDINARTLPRVPGIRRGDIVHLSEYGTFGDEGKMIHDGVRFISLAHNDDMYGYLPPEFTINEFGPHYFRNTISCNSRVWARFDNYTIEEEIVKATIGDTTYTINPGDDFTPSEIRQIMSTGMFDYTDDPLTLEYW